MYGLFARSYMHNYPYTVYQNMSRKSTASFYKRLAKKIKILYDNYVSMHSDYEGSKTAFENRRT
jgi:hypothetical protein